MQVLLHPLVLLNITDHSTRSKVNAKSKTPLRVFGALLLKSDVKQPEFSNSFELTDGKDKNINPSFLGERLKAYQEVFPELELAGIYISAPGIDVNTIQKQDEELLAGLKDISSGSSTFILKVDSSYAKLTSLGTHDALPISIFEQVKAHKGKASFEHVSHAFVSDEGERVGVSDAASLVPDTKEVSTFAVNGGKTTGALYMLCGKMDRLCQILQEKDIEGKIEQNPRLARMLDHLQAQLSGTYIDTKLEKAMDSEIINADMMSAAAIVMGGGKVIGAFKDIKRKLKTRKGMGGAGLGLHTPMLGHPELEDEDDD